MGPFVPDLISDQLNLVVALAVGFLFGFVLEQAGFSSSRRLVGVFYGYDLTVLRVFFTAAVTAAVGVLLLVSAGLLDLGAVYINPTWLYPAIVGGVLMGLGFLLGGFCPGTSVCAVAIGKLDAMVFVLGSALGVFAYAELWPALAAFADATALGPLLVPEALGIAPGTFVLLLAAAAIAAFAVGGVVERWVAPQRAPSLGFPYRRHALAAAVLLAAAVVVAVLPARDERLLARVSADGYRPPQVVQAMTPDELAFRIVDRDPRTRVVDLRSETVRAAQPLPGAVAVESGTLLGREWSSTFGARRVKKVLVADDEAAARTAAYVLGEVGYQNLAYLAGGFPAFAATILEPGPVVGEGRFSDQVARFRSQARVVLADRIRSERESAVPAASKPKVIKGGC